MIHPRATGSTIILERIDGDASGNNDRQRTTVAPPMTVWEAEALAEQLRVAVKSARQALAAERSAKLVAARRELETARRRVTEIEAEIARLARGEGGAEQARSEAEAPAADEPRVMTEQELLEGLERQGLIERSGPAGPVVPTSSQHGVASSEPDMPGFLRRTA